VIERLRGIALNLRWNRTPNDFERFRVLVQTPAIPSIARSKNGEAIQPHLANPGLLR
jgi:hypothetical protein